MTSSACEVRSFRLLSFSVLFLMLAATFSAMLTSRAAAEASADGLRLLMFERDGCEWCEQWDEEIGVAYDKTEFGGLAPLSRTNLYDDTPDGVRLARSVQFTPTFVLLKDNVEAARIEGYPGPDFFWPLLQELVEESLGVSVAEAQAQMQAAPVGE